MKQPKIIKRSARIEHERNGIVNDMPSKTKQEFADDANINVIIGRFVKTGALPLSTKVPRYLNLINTPNLQEAIHVMQTAEAHFMRLPAKVRKEFDNDPVKFADFASNKENLPKLIEWGLAPQPKPESKPIKVEVTNQPKEQPKA